jgi:hypothetical protein
MAKEGSVARKLRRQVGFAQALAPKNGIILSTIA